MVYRPLGNDVEGIMAINFKLARIFKKAKDSDSNQKEVEPENEEKDEKECPRHFGYLVKHPKNAHFPEECLLCSRLLECIQAKLVNTNTLPRFYLNAANC
jgi:hypothetical protein